MLIKVIETESRIPAPKTRYVPPFGCLKALVSKFCRITLPG